MAIIPYVQAQQVATAAGQNALITQVNTNTNAIESNSTAIDNSAALFGEMDTRITALEDQPAGNTAGTYFGQWTDANNGSGTIISKSVEGSDGGKGIKVTDINVPSGAPVGCSLSNGTFTSPNAGLWQFNFSVQFTPSNAIRAIFVCLGSSNVFNGGARLGILAGPTADALSSSCVVRLTANQQISVYSACWTTGSSVTVWRQLSNSLTATWLGP